MSAMPGVAGQVLIGALRTALRDAGDDDRAPRMQAYLKSAMPFRGVSSPEQRRIYRTVFDAHPLSTAAAWRATLRALWRNAGYREERYAAIALAGLRRYRAFEDLDALPMYDEWIVTGAWWDYVDQIAGHRLGALIERHPAVMEPQMRAWATAPGLWRRRSAILCQLRFRDRTDLKLLYACIAPNLAGSAFSDDFFIRKAIGRALRTYARVDPDEVLRFVRTHGPELSPLSKREGLKHVLPRDAIAALA